MQQQDRADSDWLTPAEIAQLREIVRQGYREIDAILAKRQAARAGAPARPDPDRRV